MHSMKLREILEELRGQAVALGSLQVENAGENGVSVSNDDKVVAALRVVADLPLATVSRVAKDLVQRYEAFPVGVGGRLIPRAKYEQFAQDVEKLRWSVDATAAALNASLPAAPADRISVKLPNTESLEDVRGVLQRLQVIFDQPLHRINEEPLMVVGVDVGSTWYELAARSAGGMAAAAALIRLLLEGFRVLADYRKAAAVIRRYDLEADIRRREAELILSVTEGVVMKLAQQWVENPTGADPPRPADPELVPVIVNSMKELLGLLQKGAVVTYSLGAGEARATESTASLPASALETQLGSGSGTPQGGTGTPAA